MTIVIILLVVFAVGMIYLVSRNKKPHPPVIHERRDPPNHPDA